MITVRHIEVSGFEAAVRGMRNPMNSWHKSDSHACAFDSAECIECSHLATDYCIGANDLDLMKRLFKAGAEHRKYLRMIHVTMDITAPLYWWKEFDTYKVGTTVNSCSTMHKIAAKEFDIGDFSHDHIPLGTDAMSDTWDMTTSKMYFYINKEDGYYFNSEDLLLLTIDALNHYRKMYLETKDKRYWWQMIQLLPTSYNQKRTVDFNYETLFTIIRQRTGHRLDEWNRFVEILKHLPYVFEIGEYDEACKLSDV